MSTQWDDLPKEVKAELTREGYGPAADPWAPEADRAALERRIQELVARGERLAERIKASMALPLDPSVFTGAENAPQGLPQVVHGEVLHPDGATPDPTPTRGEGTNLPDLPHENDSQTDRGPDEDDSQPTPVQRQDAWLTFHADIVKATEAQLRWSRACLSRALAEKYQAKWLADEWAALQLLKALRDMKAPEVPVDDTLNQPTLEEALEPVGHGHRWPCPGFYTGNHDRFRAKLWACTCTESP